MPKLLQHPRCKDFYFSPLSQGPLTLAYLTINAKYNNKLSLHLLKTLQNIRKRSFYKAIDILSYIANLAERNYLLQILYSAVTYAENNHSSNLLKIWVDDIYTHTRTRYTPTHKHTSTWESGSGLPSSNNFCCFSGVPVNYRSNKFKN